jgi:uncharacterized protein
LPLVDERSQQKQALEYLASHSVMTLATQGLDGPWAAALFYVNVGFNLYFLSLPSSRHAGQFAARKTVAATVQEDCAEWRSIKGIQLEGVVDILSGSAEASAIQLYAAKFPFASGGYGTAPEIAAALAKVRWYLLSGVRAYFIDNEAGFGRRRQVL